MLWGEPDGCQQGARGSQHYNLTFVEAFRSIDLDSLDDYRFSGKNHHGILLQPPKLRFTRIHSATVARNASEEIHAEKPNPFKP